MGNLARHDSIVKILMQRKKISVEELAEILSVTPTTIRRDLLELEGKHQVIRPRGYAMLNEDYAATDNHFRTDLFLDEKKRIAQCALEMVNSHSSIFLDSGTTLLEFAKRLNTHTELENISIVTNALDIATALFNNPLISMPGGVLHHYSKSLFGVDTSTYFSNIHADIAFMGTNGILNCPGLTVSTPLLLDIKKNMVASANRIVALSDSSKFMRRGIYTYCPFEKIDTLITVLTPENESAVNHLQEQGVHVIFA